MPCSFRCRRSSCELGSQSCNNFGIRMNLIANVSRRIPQMESTNDSRIHRKDSAKSGRIASRNPADSVGSPPQDREFARRSHQHQHQHQQRGPHRCSEEFEGLRPHSCYHCVFGFNHFKRRPGMSGFSNLWLRLWRLLSIRTERIHAQVDFLQHRVRICRRYYAGQSCY